MIRFLLLFIIGAMICSKSYALVSIDINSGNVEPLPIALPEFGASDELSKRYSHNVIEVIEQDLQSSGLFKSVNRDTFIQEIKDGNTIPQFADWRPLDVMALLTGGLNLVDQTTIATEFRLWDVLAENQIAGKRYNTHANNWRRISHMIADEIYSRLTGEGGYFDTRIVYVAESGTALNRVKRLAIMDQDGANHRYLTDGRTLALTPRFSPISNDVIYLSYRGKIPKVYIRNVDTGKEKLVGHFQGMSFAPRFSPDGKTVVMSAAFNGNSDVYSYSLNSGVQKRLTTDGAIDTSPSYSPDGAKIVFNSDRGGSQQLYIMDKNGGNVKRISFGAGRYGTPVWSPRGDYIAFTKIYNGTFYIGVMYPDGTGERLLTESFMDEGPVWAPNGRIIMFSRQMRIVGSQASKWYIYTVDLTGRNEKKIQTPGDASDPAWSPLL